MPRIKCEPAPQLIAIRERIKKFIERECHKNQSAFGRAAGVSQYQINRLLSGRTKTITADVRKLCSYAKIDLYIGIEDADKARLLEALDKVNDGQKETVDFLVRLLELVGPLVKVRAVRHKPDLRSTDDSHVR